ncbi:disulfide bond formation protein B [Bacillus sp. WMMC1349]|uniref:disulfide oxidoreductase n=1 Tax=Bacillus sp. WMMC1349 TaxID=2736254 RepID=UPI001557B800|nr:disulfide oxidoreductase [Bacillus sp. WMMC1349]NPC94156.1 disulfide bond formation protein B [Bacillus sp. WMMC1349]
MKNKQLWLYGAWIVSLTATIGSLYFSEIRRFIPCELCWYQRIMMYPLVLILGIATFQGDARVKKYVIPLAAVGAIISLTHYLQQKLPWFSGIKPCVTGVPCTGQYVNWFGFMTIPFLALTAFMLIIICMCFVNEKGK